MAKVFISYSRRDYIGRDGKVIPDNFVDKVCRALHDNGISFWIDLKGLEGGTTFPRVIASEIKACDVFLFLSSENANRPGWTLQEISYANQHQKRILPVRLDSSPYADPVALYLAAIQYIDWVEDGEEKALARIVDCCQRLASGEKPASNPVPTPAPLKTREAGLPLVTAVAISAGMVVLAGAYAYLTYRLIGANSYKSNPTLVGLVGYVCEMGILLSVYYLIRMLRMRRCHFLLPLAIIVMTFFASFSPVLLPNVIHPSVLGKPDKDLLHIAYVLFAGWAFILFCCFIFRKNGKNFFGLMSRDNVRIKVLDPENIIGVYLVFKALFIFIIILAKALA